MLHLASALFFSLFSSPHRFQLERAGASHPIPWVKLLAAVAARLEEYQQEQAQQGVGDRDTTGASGSGHEPRHAVGKASLLPRSQQLAAEHDSLYRASTGTRLPPGPPLPAAGSSAGTVYGESHIKALARQETTAKVVGRIRSVPAPARDACM